MHGVISLGEADCDREDVQKLEQTIKSDSFYVAGPVMAGQFSLDEESGYLELTSSACTVLFGVKLASGWLFFWR